MTIKVKCPDTKTDDKQINIYSYCFMYKERASYAVHRATTSSCPMTSNRTQPTVIQSFQYWKKKYPVEMVLDAETDHRKYPTME